MKCEPGWPGRQSYASCTFLEPEGRHKRPGPLSSRPRHARLARRSPARPPPRHPRPWPGLRFTPRSGALLSPSDRPPSSTTSLLRLSFSLCSNLGAVSLSVRLSWSATSGHQRGWTPSGCPGVLRSCFPNWSCSLSAQRHCNCWHRVWDCVHHGGHCRNCHLYLHVHEEQPGDPSRRHQNHPHQRHLFLSCGTAPLQL
ncbi:cysteine and tyrosine-rich protein 1 isoform X1 [Castor canadensis]|uniref:Cysteine and tyrosine-rich protein 1 isoform X1 n=1 Tax=Castor canadensis TaxID=51338 RepID=A0AC58MHT7_CASCN